MTQSEIVVDNEIISMISVIEQRTVAFMRDELSMAVLCADRRLHHEERIVLRSVTAIVGVGSRDGVYIAYSYDEALIRAMSEQYTAELAVAPDQVDLYMRETASDVVNVIIGNCTADFARRGEVIALSPPVLALGARTIQSRPKTAIAALSLRYPEGVLDVAFVGPRHLFTDNLDYRGNNS